MGGSSSFTALQIVSASILFLIWFVTLDLREKIISVFTASMFSITEVVFVGWIDGASKLPAKKRSSANMLRAVWSTGKTTWAMWFLNMAYFRLGIIWYWATLHSYWVRMLFFPLNVWFCETVGGYYLLRVWNVRAWDYRNERWACFDGLIRLDYVPVWFALFIQHDFFQTYVYIPVANALTSF